MQAFSRLSQQSLVVLALVLPWLNPFAGGPSPAVLPWLVTLGCAALALLWASETIRPDTVAQAWFVAAAVSSVMGLLQYFGVSGSLSPWVSAMGVGEAHANLRQRNQFATLTNMGLVALLWWAAQPAVARYKGFALVGMRLAAALLAMGNAVSSSRTGLVQLVLLGGLVWMWGGLRKPDARRLLVAALAAYVIATMALPALLGLSPAEHGIWGRLSSGDSTCGSRITLWRNVLHLIGQHPWGGWGWGELDYAHFITLYPGPRFCEILDNAHNLPLHLAVELGIPAALLMCGGAAWLILRARPWRELDATRQMAWGVLALILLHSMLEYPLWYGPFQMAFGLCLALLWPTRTPGVAAPAAGRRTISPWQTLLTALLMGAAAYAAWDYHRISQIYLAPQARSAAYRDNTLEKIRGSWLFRQQVRFAELTALPLTKDNAAQVNTEAHGLLHYSPEPRVVERLIESAVMLGRDDEARFYLARYQAAFPEAHARWAQALSKPVRPELLEAGQAFDQLGPNGKK